MRQEPLTGYILHQRDYKEKNRLIYFLSKEHGVVHGIGSKKASQFQPYSLYATGKGSLKRFSQMTLETPQLPLAGQALYAGMYLNELLFKVLPTEDSIYHTYHAYAVAIAQLAELSKQSDALTHIKLILREVEYNLLGELGYGVDFSADKHGEPIDSSIDYVLEVGNGFAPCSERTNPHMPPISGAWLAAVNTATFVAADAHFLGIIFRQCIDHLLEYKPLKSRDLWLSLYAK